MGSIQKGPAANVADNAAALLFLNNKVTEHVIKRVSSRTEVRVDDSRILGSVYVRARAHIHAHMCPPYSPVFQPVGRVTYSPFHTDIAKRNSREGMHRITVR